MAALSREQWLELAAGAVAIVRGANASALVADVPRAIGLAHEVASLVERVTRGGAASPGAVSAHEIARNVADDGLTPSEKAAFERASQSTGM